MAHIIRAGVAIASNPTVQRAYVAAKEGWLLYDTNKAAYKVGVSKGKQWEKMMRRKYPRSKLFRRKRKFARTISRARAQTGKRVGFSTAKYHELVGAYTSAQYALYSVAPFPLTFLPGGTAINERERNIANIRGFKIAFSCFATQNLDQRMCFNYAIVSPKTEATITATDFFKAEGRNDSRNINFQSSLLPEPLDFENRPLSTDKFKVFMHKRFYINPRSWDEGAKAIGGSNLPTVRNRKIYVKINRQLAWETQEAETGLDDPIYFIFWASQVDGATDSALYGSRYTVTQRCSIVFRDPRN